MFGCRTYTLLLTSMSLSISTQNPYVLSQHLPHMFWCSSKYYLDLGMHNIDTIINHSLLTFPGSERCWEDIG